MVEDNVRNCVENEVIIALHFVSADGFYTVYSCICRTLCIADGGSHIGAESFEYLGESSAYSAHANNKNTQSAESYGKLLKSDLYSSLCGWNGIFQIQSLAFHVVEKLISLKGFTKLFVNASGKDDAFRCEKLFYVIG